MERLILNIPTRIFFGDKILEEALVDSKDILKGIAMIVTGKSAMKRLGYINKLEEILKEKSNIKRVIVFEGISPNPKISEINNAISRGVKNNVNIVFGLGGGSVMDAAKAIAVGIGAKEKIDDYLLKGKIPNKKTLTIVAIPSTAGTGSELSKGAIISIPRRKIKIGIRGKHIFPTLAIVDPSLTYEIPKKITCETGFDVFTHAAETFISKKSSQFTRMLSIQALKILSEYLPLLVNNLDNKDARVKISYASMLMGINLGNSSTCIPHRLQYPIGAKTDTSHSSGLACIYKSWVYHTYQYSQQKFNEIGAILSSEDCSNKSDVMNSINNFIDSVEMDIRMTDLGIKESDLDELAKNVTESLENDPASVDKNIIQKIFTTAYSNIYD